MGGLMGTGEGGGRDGPGGAGDKDPGVADDGAGVADLGLKGGAGRDVSAGHDSDQLPK